MGADPSYGIYETTHPNRPSSQGNSDMLKRKFAVMDLRLCVYFCIYFVDDVLQFFASQSQTPVLNGVEPCETIAKRSWRDMM